MNKAKEMACSLSLQRVLNLARANRLSFLSRTRSFSSSSDALVEVKPGEIGIVSGIPEEHLRRRVRSSLLLSNCLFQFLDFDSFVESRLVAEKM